MVRSHLDFVQQSIDSLDSKLDDLIAPYESGIILVYLIFLKKSTCNATYFMGCCQYLSAIVMFSVPTQ